MLQGGENLKLSEKIKAATTKLLQPFGTGASSVTTVQVHANGVITFGEMLEPVGAASILKVAEKQQILPLWTNLDLDAQSEVFCYIFLLYIVA